MVVFILVKYIGEMDGYRLQNKLVGCCSIIDFKLILIYIEKQILKFYENELILKKLKEKDNIFKRVF